MCVRKNFISCAALVVYEEAAAFIAAFIEKGAAFLAFLQVKEALPSSDIARDFLENFSKRLKAI